ncbi:TIGR01777 family protein [Bdellovibrio sp. ZAP7]|uniref:TIGR01777 family oxidoreductase n=1 Tax=Bdellovibrio sp. ZAP7 TaxID=2231053 RepID=UPI00115970AD|nr:TIGR01777 family oxidoreductase [Bdellovibrio sp. ZAP7]QDK46509.1 TIGR01777 family protein [Bdellovibrio sp. ZAP7]
MNILITGATGLIGKEVGKTLAEKGHKIFAISRDANKARSILPFPCEVIEGDLVKGPLEDMSLQNIEAVINLMGESVIGSRWNSQAKKKIYDSRVVGTRNLIASLPATIKVFVGGSAIGFYGDRHDQICHEDHSPGQDFLSKVTADWEAESAKAPGRVSIIRTGIVLSPHGGAMEQMLFPFKAGLGGFLGNGRQWMSWITIQDIARLFIFALENEHVQGPFNGVAPHPVTNKYFSTILAKSLNRPLALPVPKVAIKALYGEAAETITSSVRCSSDRAQALGFRFLHTDLQQTLHELCEPFRSREEIFYSEQFIPVTPEKIFEFFKDPHNLEEITPPTLSFQIKKVSTQQIQQGTLIDYVLKIRGIPAKWKTEIDEWHPPHKFVDNQMRGPYQLWHHTHEFRSFCGGTLMTDRVRYKLPLGYFGWLIANYFVRKEVMQIFKYRREYIAKFNV